MSKIIKLSVRKSISYIDVYNKQLGMNESNIALDWLEKWRLHYRIIKNHIVNNDIHQMDILCSEEAANNIPGEISLFGEDWEERGIIEDNVEDRKMEIFYEDSPDEDFEEISSSIKLKQPLNLKEKKEA